MANKSAGIPGARMNTQSATPSSDAQTIKVQTPAGTVRGLVSLALAPVRPCSDFATNAHLERPVTMLQWHVRQPQPSGNW